MGHVFVKLADAGDTVWVAPTVSTKCTANFNYSLGLYKQR